MTIRMQSGSPLNRPHWSAVAEIGPHVERPFGKGRKPSAEGDKSGVGYLAFRIESGSPKLDGRRVGVRPGQ